MTVIQSFPNTFRQLTRIQSNELRPCQVTNPDAIFFLMLGDEINKRLKEKYKARLVGWVEEVDD